MRLQCMLIVACLLSSCAFVDGLHNQQQNPPGKPTTHDRILPSKVTTPAPVNNQNNPTTNAAKAITPLVQ